MSPSERPDPPSHGAPHSTVLSGPISARIPLFLCLAAAFLMGCVEATSEPAPASTAGGFRVRLTEAQLATVGRKIWVNECGGTVEGLTSWNRGEYFPSLGIGHFIWYHPSKRGPFEESFPKLVVFLQRNRVAVPGWVAAGKGSPWRTYEEFHAAKSSAPMKELRTMLAGTVPQQTAFIVQRLEQALPKMLATLDSEAERSLVRSRFYAVAETTGGVYALIDYVNFKGEGVKSTERYRGQGWGLLQVLQAMEGTPRGRAAAVEFGEAAKRTLQRRVRNAPAERNEQRWLSGWMNRCETYQRPL